MSGQGDSLVQGLVGMLPLGHELWECRGMGGPLVYDPPPAYTLITNNSAFSKLLKTVLLIFNSCKYSCNRKHAHSTGDTAPDYYSSPLTPEDQFPTDPINNINKQTKQTQKP